MEPIEGTLRADRRTKALVKRLRPGDIAVIDHSDLDAMAARGLLEARPAAVVNASRSVSGRYPNRGPSILIDGGIPLLDDVGAEFMVAALQRDGSRATVEDACIRTADGLCATGSLLDRAAVERMMDEASRHVDAALDSFARNTLSYLSEEKALLLDPVDVPDLRTRISGRHAMVVVRGEGHREDLAAIEAYLRDVRPVLIGVDGGAEALLDVGLRPDLIIGDMDSVSDRALRCGAELVVHGYARGAREAPGYARVQAMGLTATVFHAPGTSEDVAMLLAHEKGASLIVAVGTHYSLFDFLDKGRGGMASTFLVRLRVGSKLVDAKGIGRLWSQRSRPRTIEMLILIAAGLFPLGVIAWNSPFLRTMANTLRLTFRSTIGAD
ncbi:MAG TPA: putative cytokinetic ring protein SteA [Chthonomonadales bacterium]|nr:putative cytokinetic ring protein SteA [Chthonomonadales bacterium]